MKALWRAAFVIAGLMSTIAAGQEINWINNYPDALAEAQRTGKPLLLAFRCSP